MKIRLNPTALVLFTALLAMTAFADIAEPPTHKVERAHSKVLADPSYMIIESSETAKEAHLQIPRRMLKQMRAEIDKADDLNSVAASTDVGGIPPARTIMAGLFLSLSFVFGGLWITRAHRRPATQRVAAALLLCATLGATWATVAFANAGPPSYRPLDPGTLMRAMPSDGKNLTGAVRVEIVDDGSYFKLILPKPEPPKSE